MTEREANHLIIHTYLGLLYLSGAIVKNSHIVHEVNLGYILDPGGELNQHLLIGENTQYYRDLLRSSDLESYRPLAYHGEWAITTLDATLRMQV